MSTFQVAYIAMVITGMVTLMVLLAWGMWHTRTRRGDAAATPSNAVANPEAQVPPRRLAA